MKTRIAEQFNDFLSNIIDASQSQYISSAHIIRSAFGVVLFLNLLFNNKSILFYSEGDPEPQCRGSLDEVSIYCLLGLEAGTILSLAILLASILGLAPALFSWLQWWVSWSFSVSSNVVDGGDQALANFLLILAIGTIGDKNLLAYSKTPKNKVNNLYLKSISFILFNIQVSAIYLHSTLAKVVVEEWRDGSAIWYWLQYPLIISEESFVYKIFIDPFIMNPAGSYIATFGTIGAQIFLFHACYSGRILRSIALPIGLLFHVSIGIIMGLWTFSLTMVIADYFVFKFINKETRC